MSLRVNRRVMVGGLLAALSVPSRAAGAGAEAISLALQDGGTAAWEIAAMRAVGLDSAHGIVVEVRDVADSRAGQVALQAAAVEVILSDFIFVSGQRHRGADLTFVPHSLAVGGVMVDPKGPVRSVADLAGKTLAVAGGPLDKSYVVLQAYFNAKTGKVLPDLTTVEFGAPPLVNEMLTGGQVQAALNFWHFNVRARLAGMVELISVKDMLAQLGVPRQPPLLGWVFSEKTARDKGEAVRRFLDASFATKDRLLTDDGIWEQIRPVMRGAEADDALFVALRDGYRAGIVTSYGVADIQAATESYALIAQYGGGDGAIDLAQGTFWSGYSK